MERNPFVNVNSPNPLLTREGFVESVVNPSLRKEGAGVSYETRRSDLKPDVRKYADKLHVQILEI